MVLRFFGKDIRSIFVIVLFRVSILIDYYSLLVYVSRNSPSRNWKCNAGSAVLIDKTHWWKKEKIYFSQMINNSGITLRLISGIVALRIQHYVSFKEWNERKYGGREVPWTWDKTVCSSMVCKKLPGELGCSLMGNQWPQTKDSGILQRSLQGSRLLFSSYR